MPGKYIPTTQEECKLNEIIDKSKSAIDMDLKSAMIRSIISDEMELSFDLRDMTQTYLLLQFYCKQLNQIDSCNYADDDDDDDDDLPA